MATVHMTSANRKVAAGRLTAAEVEAGYVVAVGRPGWANVIHDVHLRAIGGGAAGADSVDVQDETSATKAVVALVAALTQDAWVTKTSANVTATNCGVVLGSGEGIKLIAAGVGALAGASHIDYIVEYARKATG